MLQFQQGQATGRGPPMDSHAFGPIMGAMNPAMMNHMHQQAVVAHQAAAAQQAAAQQAALHNYGALALQQFLSGVGSHNGASQDYQFWLETEHARFLEAIQKPGGNLDYKEIAHRVGSRNAAQVEQHVQLYLVALTSRQQDIHSAKMRLLSLGDMYGALSLGPAYLDFQMKMQMKNAQDKNSKGNRKEMANVSNVMGSSNAMQQALNGKEKIKPPETKSWQQPLAKNVTSRPVASAKSSAISTAKGKATVEQHKFQASHSLSHHKTQAQKSSQSAKNSQSGQLSGKHISAKDHQTPRSHPAGIPTTTSTGEMAMPGQFMPFQPPHMQPHRHKTLSDELQHIQEVEMMKHHYRSSVEGNSSAGLCPASKKRSKASGDDSTNKKNKVPATNLAMKAKAKPTNPAGCISPQSACMSAAHAVALQHGPTSAEMYAAHAHQQYLAASHQMITHQMMSEAHQAAILSQQMAAFKSHADGQPAPAISKLPPSKPAAKVAPKLAGKPQDKKANSPKSSSPGCLGIKRESESEKPNTAEAPGIKRESEKSDTAEAPPTAEEKQDDQTKEDKPSSNPMSMDFLLGGGSAQEANKGPAREPSPPLFPRTTISPDRRNAEHLKVPSEAEVQDGPQEVCQTSEVPNHADPAAAHAAASPQELESSKSVGVEGGHSAADCFREGRSPQRTHDLLDGREPSPSRDLSTLVEVAEMAEELEVLTRNLAEEQSLGRKEINEWEWCKKRLMCSQGAKGGIPYTSWWGMFMDTVPLSKRHAHEDVRFITKQVPLSKQKKEDKEKDAAPKKPPSNKNWLQVGEYVEVKYAGEWWQAKIKKTKWERGVVDKVLIHYVGGTVDEQEWIAIKGKRIRPPTEGFMNTSKGD